MSYSHSFQKSAFIIIPVYNRKEITLTCIKHLDECDDLSCFQIVVVDDGSTDGTREALADLYPQVKVLPGDGNLWWTGAMARGMEYACKQGAEFVIWLNDDCLPKEGTLKGLVEFMRIHPSTLVAPSCITLSEGEVTRHHNGCCGRQGLAAEVGEVVDVEGLAGWCVGMPIAVIEAIGLPDAKKFPHYSGDDMYTYKASQNGFRVCLNGTLEASLVGPVHDQLSIRDYFKYGIAPGKTLKAIFWNYKSPYRLPTQFFYFMEKYGYFIGTLLFTLKLISWLSLWLKYQFLSFSPYLAKRYLPN
ncbi:glycosyltransferase family 2 protein [Leptolyngbya sp. BC1307]|uniref:glycosyltransferase family 2 protein n=1 Tax=Leptolyngbya sp. BC1307 TaxID=2029589 RepID=UPI000EFCC0BC|nr:glycosyltransferase family 2 protein [Leptolyngbya sp. BC1307]